MFRALTKLCLVGAPILAMACTGQIDGGTATGSKPSKPGKGGGMEPDPAGGGGGTEMPPGGGGGPTMMPPSLDPPATISTSNKCTSSPTKPGPRMLRRLTAEQLDNTIRDLFGKDGAPRNDVFNDPQVLGFTGDANALLVRDLGSQQLMNYAEQVARWAVSTIGPTLSPCTQMTADCRLQFIKKFGERAFRQPLTDARAARYEKLFATGATFEAGLEVTIAAMLQSPYLLYRRELGEADPAKPGQVKLTSYEIASNISYLITRSMPDEALFTAAAANQLQTRAQIDAQVERLLMNPKNRATVNTFMSEWLETKRVEGVLKDPNIFNFPDALRSDMEAETAALIEDVVFGKNGTLADLFTADYTFVNASLAKHYGITGVTGTDLVKVPAPHDTGILAHGSLMAGHAGMTFSSPTLRGKLVRTRFLCEDLPPPPSNVNTNIMPPKEAKTTREIFQAHVDNPACGGCHSVMDKIGFGFENYDVAGKYRTMENGVAVDTSGTIIGTPEVTFKGLGELNDYLSKNDNVRACMVRFMSYYSYGATGWADDGCTIDAINNEAKGSNWSIRSVLIAITHAPHFTTRVQ